MDLTLSSQQQAFRKEVIAFLKGALTPELMRAGRVMTSIFSDFEASIQWQKILHAKGWAAIDWPKEYGGTGWDLTQRSIFQEESKKRGAPSLFPMGLQMLGPIIIRYGTEQQRAELLPRILDGSDIWCQGYSEPGAGSDLASLKMKAERDGGEYVLNGSKIWTSYAHVANKIFCLVRTDNDAKPQAGISFVLVNMDLPGIEVKPIVSIDGEVEQCQVFFDDVRIPISDRIGDENQGWEIAKYLLEFERGGYSYYCALDKQLSQIRDVASDTVDATGKRYLQQPVFRQTLAEHTIDKLALEYTEHRIKQMVSNGANLGALTSLPKVVGTELSQKLDDLALELVGNHVAVKQNHVFTPSFNGDVIGNAQSAHFTNAYLNNRASTIYGGTAQIQRNIIAKMVLGK